MELRPKSKPGTANLHYCKSRYQWSNLKYCGWIDQGRKATDRPSAVAYLGRIVADLVWYGNTRNWIGVEMIGRRNRRVDVGLAHGLAEGKVVCLLNVRCVAGVWEVRPSCYFAVP